MTSNNYGLAALCGFGAFIFASLMWVSEHKDNGYLLKENTMLRSKLKECDSCYTINKNNYDSLTYSDVFTAKHKRK